MAAYKIQDVAHSSTDFLLGYVTNNPTTILTFGGKWEIGKNAILSVISILNWNDTGY